MIRHFLGWNRPLAESAAQQLARDFAVAGGGVDLTSVHIITPGGRFGRQLIDRIALAKGPVLGQVFTIEDFFTAALPRTTLALASDWPRRLAWLDSYQQLTGEHQASLWPATIRDSISRSLAMVNAIDATSSKLAGEGILFEDAARAVVDGGLPDRPRWEALARLQSIYLDQLARDRLADEAIFRISAARELAELAPNRVILIGILQLPGLLRRILVSPRVEALALIAAPESHAHLFDDMGAADTDAWRDHSIPIDDRIIRIAEGPDEQARLALLAAGAGHPSGGTAEPAYIPSWGTLNARDVVISVPDEEVQRSIERLAPRLAAPTDGRVPIRFRTAAGSPASRTPPGRLLRLVADFLADPEFPQFAALLRHRDIELAVRSCADQNATAILGGDTDLLRSLDEYAAEHIHGAVNGRWLGADTARNRLVRIALDFIYAGITAIMGPLWKSDRPAPARALSEWARPIVDMVRGVFDHSADDATTRACDAIEAIARGMADLAGSTCAQPEVSPAIAVRLVLSELSGGTIPGEQDPGAIELVGWLEAAYDPAPVLILTGMNEGSVPRDGGSDAFLPERLRAVLGLQTRFSGLARDKCLLMQAISCRNRVLITAGRRTRDGDRRWPSRLLLATDDRRAVDRLERFLTESRQNPAAHPKLALRESAGRAFELMPLGPDRPVEAISVTAFRRYLASPYAFYVEHVLALKEIAAEPMEMEPPTFGTFIHRVLERFAAGPARDSTDPEVIEQDVMRHLDEHARIVAGDDPPTAVTIQIEQARHRLKGFSAWQARHAGAGWRILHTEWKPARAVYLDVDVHGIELRGRIDRIDINRATREIALLDYKTSDNAADPDAAYRTRRAGNPWSDLQLPLYRRLAGELIEHHTPSKVHLGYITLPKDGDVEFAAARWSDDVVDSGIETARSIVRDIRSRRWRLRGENPPDEGTIAALCGLSVLLPPEKPLAEGR